MAINKVEFDGTTLIDLSNDTLSNSNQIVAGIVGHLRDGTQVTGTYQGGGTEGYTLTNIVPSQSVTATTAVSNAYMVQIPTYTDVLEPGYAYLVNYDGDDYVLWCYEGWTQEYLIGDNQIVDSTYIDRLISPFTIDYGVVDDELIFISRDTNAHTIKVDKITLIDPTATLISKTITQNGTYNASSDNADGYSSVTVNVGSSVQYKAGTYTTATKYNSTGNRAIVTISDIGFTPKYFLFYIDEKSDITATQYAVVNASSRSPFGTDNQACRIVVRTTNTSGTVAGYCANTSWNTQTNGYLYLSDGTIYFRTTSSYIIEKGVTYRWEAYG